jgi:long-chain acyl-CoA synthetase
MAEETHSALVNFLSDPATLVGLGVVAAGTAYYLSSRTTPFSPPVPLGNQTSEVPGGERARKSPFQTTDDLMTCFHEDAKTLYQSFQRGKRESKNGPCLGWRVGPDHPYQWLSYQEVEDAATQFGAGLVQLGVETGQDSFVGAYARNSPEWVVAEQSCNYYSRVLVPLYDTLGAEAVAYIINQTCMSVVVCEASKLLPLIKHSGNCPSLRLIITMANSISSEERDAAQQAGLVLHTMSDVKKMGRETPVELMPASVESLATICYTSGTTGNPKGVILTNENMVADASGVLALVESSIKVGPEDVHISYLPLAHMMERLVELFLFMNGARIGFFRGDVKELVNDIQALKPTFFVSVPRLLNRVYDKVIAGVSTSPVKKWLFQKAMASKRREIERGVIRRDSMWDWIVFNKVQNTLGGRVRVIVTGSAPISAKVMDFLRCAFGCLVLEGYGQTECAAAASGTVPGDIRGGHVGVPLPCNLIKLVDVAEMDYFAENGEGEVCFKGPNVFKGYYKDEEKTKEALDSDGWLHSGDIGRWEPNGTLRIVDRKKNIFKLAQVRHLCLHHSRALLNLSMHRGFH